MHRDHKGRHSPATSRIAKMMRGNTSPKERGGPARKPGNPGPGGIDDEVRAGQRQARADIKEKIRKQDISAKKVSKIETIRERQPKIGEKEWEDVEKSGGYRKALPKTLKRMYKHHPQWARKG